MRAGHLAGWTALAAALLVAAGVLLPIPPQLLTNWLDPAFGATLHLGAAHGYAVGTRLISTFGPLGFVFYDQYFPATFIWLLVLRAALAAATCWTLAWIGAATWGAPWGSAVALFLCVPFFAAPDVWFLILPLLALLIELPERRVAPPALRTALGAAIGLASLIKFTFLLAALAVLAPMTAASLLARRRIPLVAAAAVLAAVPAWFAAGQTAADWLNYLDWSVREISSAYASAMQLPTDALLILHALAVSLAVFIAAALLVRRRLRRGRWAALLALAGALYLLFKAGFVRADVHVYVTTFALLVIALLLALLWARQPLQVAAAALLVAVLPGGLWLHTLVVEGPPFMYFRPIFPVEAVTRLVAAPFVLGGDALDRANARRAADIRAAIPLPPLRGTVDVYSNDQIVALAYDFDLQPRPVFHSYMAYSPRLARANADALLGDRAPEWIVYRVSPIDGRLPALDDAPSWPLFMTRYQLADAAGEHAVLQRRATPLSWRLEPLERLETTTGSAVAVPSAAEGPIWARVDVHGTRRDALVAALLAAPVTYIGIVRRDGQAHGFRLVPALAREGFLLSPVVETTADFTQLLARQPDPERANDATELTVQIADTPGIDPGPRALTVEFFRLRIDG